MKAKALGFTCTGTVRNGSAGRFYLDGRTMKHNKSGLIGGVRIGYTKKILAAICEVKNEDYADEGSAYALQTIKKSRDKLMKGFVRKYIRLACQSVCDNVSGSTGIANELAFAALKICDDKASVYSIGGTKVYLIRNGVLTQASRENGLSKMMSQNPNMLSGTEMPEPAVESFGDVRSGDVFVLCGYSFLNVLTDFEVSRIWDGTRNQKKFMVELSRKMLEDKGLKDFTLVTVGVFS